MTRIALLGAGRIGQVHARAVSSVDATATQDDIVFHQDVF